MALSRETITCGERNWIVSKTTVVVIGLSTLLQIACSQSTPSTSFHSTGSSPNLSDTARLDGVFVRLVPKIFATDFPNYALAINGSLVTLSGGHQGQKVVYTNCENNKACVWKLRREVVTDQGSECTRTGGQGKEVFMFGNEACPSLYIRLTKIQEGVRQRHARLVASGIWGEGFTPAEAFFHLIPACRSGNQSYYVIISRSRYAKGLLAVRRKHSSNSPVVTTFLSALINLNALRLSKDADCTHMHGRREHVLFKLDEVRR